MRIFIAALLFASSLAAPSLAAPCDWVVLPAPSYEACVNGTIALHAAVESSAATYEWRRVSDGQLIATGPNPVVPAASLAQSGEYQCVATVGGEGGCSQTSPSFSIVAVDVPVLTPGSNIEHVVCGTDDIVLEVQVAGPGAHSYQWYKGTVALADSPRIVGSTTSTLRILHSTLADVGDYRCIVTNACDTRVSGAFIVNVVRSLEGVLAPPSVTLCGPTRATLNAAQSPLPTLTTIRWYRGDTALENGGRISGATTTSLVIDPVEPADTLEPFYCVFTNACETVSTPGILVKQASPFCSLAFQRVATGLGAPLHACSPVGDFERLFIVQRNGTIRVFNRTTNAMQSQTYLSISGVSQTNDNGFTGLAFHPRFHENGYFYVLYSNSGSDEQLVRYRAQTPYMTSLAADPASATVIGIFDQSGSVRKGGWIGFRPDDTDGYLYIALGDGGLASSARDTTLAAGKILRIDVDGLDNVPGNGDDADPVRGTAYQVPPTNPFVNGEGLDEVIALGVRDPWGNSFDRETGDMFFGDVAQSVEDEISMIPAADPLSTAINFGWPCFEGRVPNAATEGCMPLPTGLTGPVFANGRNGGGCYIVGGYVHRGPLVPSLNGYYLFSDACTGSLFAMDTSGVTQGQLSPTMPFSLGARMETQGSRVGGILAFGEDADGGLYVMDVGALYRIVDLSHVAVDCNGNGVDDVLDLIRGTDGDCDGDGVLDSCDPCCLECLADFDRDGGVTGADVTAFFAAFEGGGACADADGDGGVTGGDIAAFFVAYEAGGC